MKVLCFGIARDIAGASEIKITTEEVQSVSQLRRYLEEQFPKFQSINQYMVAINEAYAEDTTEIKSSDHIAIIPPVSGG